MKPRHLLIPDCGSLSKRLFLGQKAYERGDYYEAVMQAVNRLRQNPDHDKSKEALKNAYPLR
jgi:hypothetical protein